MTRKYADRMENIKASEIRELLKLTQKPEIISFAGGLPAPETFPVQGIEDVMVKVLREDGAKALQYGPTEGYEPLRELIAKRMNSTGIECESKNILVTSGSQQGLDFSAKIFINKDDIIICESPTYLGAINAFKAYDPKFIEIATDDDGMDMAELELALKGNDNVKMIYVIPDFQNPSGRTWTAERRQKLVELANKYEVVIVEDNPYGELRYEGERIPPIKHYDTEGRVIFLGTFSKILCPGLRLGWVVADPEILSKYIMVKQGADLQSTTILQILTARFFEDFDIDEHISNIIELYRTRRDVMLKMAEEHFPEEIEITYPKGGLFTWVVLPEYMNAREIALKALELKVAYVPGGSFYVDGGHENTFRLNYSNMSEEKIIEGMKRLAEVIKKEMR